MLKFSRTSKMMAVVTMAVLCGQACISTMAAAQERYVPVAEGTLDTETGLIWGFSSYHTESYLHDIGIHDSGVSTWSWEFANATRLNCNDDGSGFCYYADFSNAFAFGDNVDAYNYDWRLPTIEEYADADMAGLFQFLDAGPAEGQQLLWMDSSHWSMTEAGKKRGHEAAYAYSPVYGIFTATKASNILAIFVRGVEPPVDDGNGGGKGKNK